MITYIYFKLFNLIDLCIELQAKLKSEPHKLNHGDKLSLGSCKLLLHIHEGYDTCDFCEPGQVLAEIASHTGKYSL